MKRVNGWCRKCREIFQYLYRILETLSGGGITSLMLIILFAAVSGITPTISVLLMQDIVNAIQLSTRSYDKILLLIISYVSIDVAVSIISLLSAYVETMLQKRASIKMNMALLEKAKDLTVKDFENSETYNKLQRALETGITRLFTFFKSFTTCFQSLIGIITFGLVLASWKWWLLPIVFLLPIANSVSTAYFGKQQFEIHKERVGKERLQWYLRYILTNEFSIKENKIFDLGAYLRNKYKHLSLTFLEQDQAVLKRSTYVQSAILILEQAISAALFLYIISRAFIGEFLIGTLVTYTRCIANIKSSTQSLLAQISSMYQNMLYIKQYYYFLDQQPHHTCKKRLAQTRLVNSIPFIEIKNLSYRYQGQSGYAVNALNLRIEKNDLVAFIGRNGSGKTTLIKILSTLYDDYEGEVYFGENEIRELEVNNVRSKIGILFQDFVRYELPIRENVGFGQLSKLNDDSAIYTALSQAGLNNRFKNLDLQLGVWFENGVQLSGGEWLKVGLSRVFMRDADLYLLDEPNAALDPISEKQILNDFKKLTSGKIGIIVSHRISSIKNVANKIVVFDEGKVQAVGTHEQLMKTSAIYREMYENEQGQKEDGKNA